MAAPENPRVTAARLALAVRRLRAEKENLDLVASDPIAIVGMGCRFPGGATSPEEFWTALQEGRDGIGEVPPGRWKDAAALEPRMRRGGFLPVIDGFDAAYFGIAPREAQYVDPQQRLLMEVVWEALWDAGIEPAGLSGADTGVFVAIYNSDYARLHFRDTSHLAAYAGIGAAHSVAAGRLSFLLNIKGPSLALDSACSSSLVATHLACQSLRDGECGMAIVAASSLKLLSDEVLVFSRWGMLASDGKCKTFDAAADGFVPGEGSGALILKRLSDALQDGDRVRAVIRGTAVNHDGRTTVLTAPSGLAQQAVLRAALKNAMLEPRAISYIETHGTGTSLGDPIEVEAIAAVYGKAEAEAPPCVLGAVKTNLGHLEASAGIAGLIKAVLCLEHGAIPRNLHFHTLNPEISLAGTRLQIPTETVAWGRTDRPRVVGVSSFGLGGTNSHILVEEAPALPARNGAEGGRTIPLTAHRWERQRFWVAESAPAPAEISASRSTEDFICPLLEKRIESPFVEGALFASDLNAAAYPYLAEHSLGDRTILPFAAYLEMAMAAVREAGRTEQNALRNFLLREPCFISSSGCRVQVLAAKDAVEIASESGRGWITNAKGSFATAGTQPGSIDLAGLQARCTQKISPDDLYQRLERTGLRYGTSFRTVQSVWSGRGESLAHVRVANNLVGEAHRSGLHPTLLDGCLQTVVVARGEGNDDLYLPIGVDTFELSRAGITEVWVHTKITSLSEETLSADLVIADLAGVVVAHLAGFTAKRTSVQAVEALANLPGRRDDLTYALAWRALPLAPVLQPIRSGERWLLVERRDGSCLHLAELLTGQGAVCETVRDGEFHAAAVANASWKGVVYDARGVGARQSGESAGDAAWEHPEKGAIDFLLRYVQSLAASGSAARRLWVVSSSAVSVLPSEDVSVEQAPLWGMVRTLALEYPESAPVLVDMGLDHTLADVGTMLAEEITASAGEPMVAFRTGKRYVARLVHSGEPAEVSHKLQFSASGRLEDLCMEPETRREPGPHEVEIEVRASGLNFRDVLTAMGMFAARSATPGAECSGTIVRVGPEVQGWKVGDNVLAFAPGSLQSHVCVPADFVVRKPGRMTFADAAGIPVAFLTAHYGLDRLAKLAAGQSILIHAAAGGLGMAAVRLALCTGARVLATAGSPRKREILKRMGVEHVFDSRSLAFRDQVWEATGGAGVDVVLNSLAGDFIRASFDVVANGGCFLEVGKRGIWSAEDVTALGKKIRYFPFDLGDVALAEPTLIAAMLRELMERFASGKLAPLPTTLYGFEDASEAFRTMAQARHIGKIVLGVGDDAAHQSVHDLVSEGTVLITGGLGALGVETARWLAAQGARNIVLAGRNVPEGREYPIATELRAQGIDVAIERTDVADSGQLERLLEKIRATRPPLCAVIHAAGVVQDSTLEKESWRSYRDATTPKIAGAWNLHRLTRNDPVRLMVFYSSAAAILGSAGQGSYAAGNAFLDALAHHRASRGLRTLSVDWGAWATAGMAARRTPEQTARAERQGARSMEPADALAALEHAIKYGRTQVTILDMGWRRFLGEHTVRRDGALFTELSSELRDRDDVPDLSSRRSDAVTTEIDILENLRSAPEAERKALLSAHIKVSARRALGLDARAAIEDTVPLQDIGLDSLMALEMRNDLAQSLSLTLAAGLLFDTPTVAQLSQYLLGLLAESLTANTVSEAPDSPISALDSLSEEEAERLLIQELERAERE